MKRYEIQEAMFDEFYRGEFESPEFRSIFTTDDHNEVLEKFASYCSGNNDYLAPHDNQNHSKARFYRIIDNGVA